jgi:hypothetical protein
MAFWAQLDNDNKVIQVTIGDDNSQDKGLSWLIENIGGTWIETILENYAGIGWTYVEGVGFYSPQPYSSWILNGLVWEAPSPKPEGDHYWNEETLEWVHVELS